MFAAITDEMSDEFKQILNEEGQLVITDTSNSEIEDAVLRGTINKYETDQYGFQAYFINQEKTICRIYINQTIGVLGNHIIYVPTETESTREALAAAVQKRVDEYVGKGKVKITAGEGTIEDYYNNYSSKHIAELENKIAAEKAKEKPNQNLICQYENEIDWYKDYVERYVKESYNNPEGEHYFLQSAEGNYWFVATINGVDYEFIVIKDSDSMIVPQYKTSDLKTDIEISSTSTSVPLDTFVEANKLIEGAEYEKIIKILGIKENETFDINLFSKSLAKYIKKLDDGNFEVKIPVPEKFKNKELVVYYVDENNKVEEYEVEIKDGCAVFKTNHFSTYTLAEKVEKKEDNNNSENKENTNMDSTEKDNNIVNNINKLNNSTNPSTGDNILLYLGMFIISVIGIILTSRLKKEDKKK